jgi:hypothetical protein
MQARFSQANTLCPEAVELLKEKRVCSRTFAYLRKMKP